MSIPVDPAFVFWHNIILDISDTANSQSDISL